MKIHDLDRIRHPDFNDVVVPFTGRSGPSRRPEDVSRLSDWARLQSVLQTGTLRGFEMPGTEANAICFTEATAEGCSWMISSGRYTSCGLAFTKRFLFRFGGGPVLQVRGDEWGAVRGWPPRLRARAVRLWPGADAEHGESLPWWLEGRSEWLYEREWRIPVNRAALRFSIADVAFLVLPSRDHLTRWVAELAPVDQELAADLAACRYVVLSETGVVDSNGVISRSATARLRTDER